MNGETVDMVMMLLSRFTSLTVLEVNTKKTQLMVAGTEDWPVGQRVCGVTIVDNVKLLGVGIYRKLEKLDDNWEDVMKMRMLSGYWCNFGMSITGRVMVASLLSLASHIYDGGSYRWRKRRAI
jgi:hypothetical protein